MLKFIARYSTQLLACCVALGFLFPNFSNTLLAYLPMVLFGIMMLTMLSLDIRILLKDLSHMSVWHYALWHSIGVTILVMSLVFLLKIDSKMYLAIAASCASGSLFASPAIVRSLGLNAQRCMAMTIASTLLMPIILLINGYFFSHFSVNQQLQLNMLEYSQRLLIFIIVPIVVSLLLRRIIAQQHIDRALVKLRPFTIVLVFFFPLGLMGALREIYEQDAAQALDYLYIASAICLLLFITTYLLFLRYGKELAMISAITATNRNVLLTYSITGGFLGEEFLIYMGALQLPIYLLPLVVKLAYRSN